jgi:hypothetical protein
VIVFDDCGHFISHDKSDEAAKAIVKFIDQHSYRKVNNDIYIPLKSKKIDLSILQTLGVLCFFLVFVHFLSNNVLPHIYINK